VSRAETVGIVNVTWFVSAIYFVAGPNLAYLMALLGFGLVAAGCSYTTFRVRVLELVRDRFRR
jgi:hypothetical protein